MKKVLISVLVVSGLLSLTVFAEEAKDNTNSRAFKQLVLSKQELKKKSSTKKYIPQIEKILVKLPEAKLKVLAQRISEAKKNKKLYMKYKVLFNYLEAKLYFKLSK